MTSLRPTCRIGIGQVGWSASELQQPPDGAGDLGEFFVRVSRGRGVDHAVAHVILEQSHGNPFQGFGQRRDLGEDVDAVPVLLHHPVDAPGLAFDPAQPREVAVLIQNVAVVVGLVRALTIGALTLRGSGLIRSGHYFTSGEIERNPRRRRLFVTTNTEENAIAAPAIIGLSRPSAASGIAATLYANAQNRLPLIVPSVRLESRIASTAARRSPRTRVTSAAAIAASVPVPIASPRSAWARAAASLTPSPTIATCLPCSCSSVITETLPSGMTSACTCSIPTSSATALATRWASPVRSTGVIPSSFRAETASVEVSLSPSERVMIPRTSPSQPTVMLVRPAS